MNKITFTEFSKLFKPIEEFLNEHDKANEAIEILCPKSYPSISLGGNLLDNYIDLLEKFLDIENYISWFVYDNDLGKRKLEMYVDDKEYKICNLKDFYNYLTI